MRISIATMLLLLAACGGAQNTKDEKNDGIVRPLTQGQLTVAHYSTPDGLKGLVLDRTGGKFKVRIDGDDAIIELTPEEDRHGGQLRGHYLVSPDNRRLLYLSAYGGLTMFTDRDELHLSSDKAARPLGAATVAGRPVKEKLEYEVMIEELHAISVRKKNSKLTSADASNLAKVAEAFRSADASMLVRYRAREGQLAALHRLDPVEHQRHQLRRRRAPHRRGVEQEGHRAGPLRRDHQGLLPAGEPRQSPVRAGDGGLSGAAGRPEPFQHSLVGISDVTALAKAGAVPTKLGDDLIAIDDEWNSCAQKVWKRAKRDFDRLKTANIDWSTRAGRQEALMEKWTETARKDCRGASDKLEKSLVQIIEDRNKERLTIYGAAKGRVGK